MSAPTVAGTGSMRASRPELPPPAPGFYLRHRSQGFVAHISPSPAAFHAVRDHIATVLVAYRVHLELVEDVQLVFGELYSNAVQACGEHAPLVVDVHVTWTGVVVSVHDPRPDLLPRRPATAADSTAESGRGLLLLDTLAPGWTIRPSPVGKQIRCLLGA